MNLIDLLDFSCLHDITLGSQVWVIIFFCHFFKYMILDVFVLFTIQMNWKSYFFSSSFFCFLTFFTSSDNCSNFYRPFWLFFDYIKGLFPKKEHFLAIFALFKWMPLLAVMLFSIILQSFLFIFILDISFKSFQVLFGFLIRILFR